MGNYIPNIFNFGQTDSAIESLQGAGNNIYRYPSKTGAYFADHFMMAGTKFDNINSETFLFGDLNDLNYLSNKPVPFPYNSPAENEPSQTIKLSVHLRKETLRLVKEQDGAASVAGDIYHVEFTFDSNVRCGVRIFMMATEDVSSGVAMYTPRKPELGSDVVYFNKGTKHLFSSANFHITPDEFQPSELNYIPGSPEIPLVIQITAEEPDLQGQSESTFAGIEKLSDNSYTMKFMKQKIMVNGFSMMIQELYGIENKNEEKTENNADDDDFDDDDDDTKVCVICMSQLRDIILLPCRHLCLCNTCAEQMKNKENRCPICRAHFHALLRLKAQRRKQNGGSCDDSYEEVPLIEALNGNFHTEDEPDKVPHSGRIKRRSSSNRSRKRLKDKHGSLKNIKLPPTAQPHHPAKITPTAPPQYAGKITPTSPLLRQSPELVETKIVRPSTPTPPDEKYDIPLTTMVQSAREDESNKCATDRDSEHLEASLPGTPMEEGVSTDVLINNSSVLSSSRGSLVIAKAQVTASSPHANNKTIGVERRFSAPAHVPDTHT